MKFATLHAGRQALRLPLSPVKAEMALKALGEWREPAVEGRERGWYRVTNAADGAPARVDIYDEISWWGISAQDFVDHIAGISGDLEVHINSPGGDAFDGICIFNALYQRPGNVTTVVDGLAASAASVIAMAGSTRVMSPGSMLMIHDALAMTIGNESDHLETAKLLGKVSGNIADVYAAQAGKTAAEWRQAMQDEGWYTAQEAVDAGLAHRIAEKPATDGAPAAAAGFDRSVFATWQGRISNADVDESSWDGDAAMAGCTSAADYRAICAGEKTVGEPDERQHWALPHHKSPGAAPNRAGVNNAKARIGETQDLKNKSAAQEHLDQHAAAMGGDGDGTSNQAEMPSWLMALTAKEAAGR